MCGFLHFAPSLMTFCIHTLFWPLGTEQYKVVANDYVTACLTLFNNTLLRFQHVIDKGSHWCCHAILPYSQFTDSNTLRC